ncbi:MAG: cation transporter [Lentisphaerae bacterium]|nr:cation transporter [Lentisphaerota bacterium]
MQDTTELRERDICRVTYFGAWVNAVLTSGKLLAGIFGHSAAMVADAVHSLSDFATDLAVIVFIKVASKPSDESHDFGHGKFETLSAVIIGLALFAVGAGIFGAGAAKIVDVCNGKTIPRPGIVALIAAVASIATKELLYRQTRKVGEGYGSSAVVANAWHHRSDAFSSIGTFLGIGGAIVLGDRWLVLDPIAAVIVSLMIFQVAYEIVMPGLNELLEKSLPRDAEDDILRLVSVDPLVQDPHNLRTRRLGGGIVAQIHIRVPGEMSVAESHEITRHIEDRMHEKFGELAHIIVHTEPAN